MVREILARRSMRVATSRSTRVATSQSMKVATSRSMRVDTSFVLSLSLCSPQNKRSGISEPMTCALRLMKGRNRLGRQEERWVCRQEGGSEAGRWVCREGGSAGNSVDLQVEWICRQETESEAGRWVWSCRNDVIDYEQNNLHEILKELVKSEK